MASDGYKSEATADYNPQAPFSDLPVHEDGRELSLNLGSSPPRSHVGSSSHAAEAQPRQSRGSPVAPTVRVLATKTAAVPGHQGTLQRGADATSAHSTALAGGASETRAPESRGASEHVAPAAGHGEIYDRVAAAKRVVTQYRPSGRFARQRVVFSSDLSVGKFGVLGEAEAEAVEQRLFVMLNHDDFSITGKSEAFRNEFLLTLRLFLAINSGSIGNTVGRMGVRDDSQPLCFQDAQISAADVASVLGDRAYAYMRARATEIRDTIEAAFATSILPHAERDFPGVCRAVDLIKVVAAAKGISQYPQYAAVGSEYAVGTPPYLIALIKESATRVLNSTQGNVRETNFGGLNSSSST